MTRRPGMIAIGDTLISSEVIEEVFTCDIASCKGECCVAGELGAPLEKEELTIMDEVYPEVEPYLRPEGRRAIEEQGKYVFDIMGEYSTPLVEAGKECAYVTFSEEGVAKCGIEEAYHDGKIEFQKPVSCHLYPIRVSSRRKVDLVNYDRWDICKAACALGKETGIKVYEFVKTALIRKFGKEWYKTLDQLAKAKEKQEKD